MNFKHDGYFGDGSACIYAFDDNGVKVMIYRGFVNLRNDTVTLYPKTRLAPTTENVGKQTIPIRWLK